MHRTNRFMVWLLAGAPLCGCQVSLEDMKAMRPQRPAELDRLNAFVGKWRGEGTVQITGLDRPLQMSETAHMYWEGDGWYLVADGRHDMEEFGPSQGKAIWTYDPKARLYRTSWVDSNGETAQGTVRYDAATNTWHMRANGHTPFGKTVGKGTIRFDGPDTMTWDWTAYDGLGVFKHMALTGTSQRLSE